MFEITRCDEDRLEYYTNERIAYPKGVYDFTFEDRFLIYHAPMTNEMVYLAIDKETNLSSRVCRINDGIFQETDYIKLIPDVLRAIKYTGDRRFLNMIAQNPLEVIDMIFRKLLPLAGYSIREEQIALSKKMFLGLTEKEVAICEAEVGTGKSMAYLVAGFCARKFRQINCSYLEPVTIATSSIELQTALVEKEIPRLSNILMNFRLIEKPLTAVLRKGKEHYFCQRRFDDYYLSLIQTPKNNMDKIEFFENSDFENRAFDLDKVKISDFIKERVCVKDQCGTCSDRDECKYHWFMRQAMDEYQDLDFQVTNHNLYLMSANGIRTLRKSSQVIIDEAHKLKGAAEDVFGACLYQNDIPQYLKQTHTACAMPRKIAAYNKLQTEIAAANGHLFRLLKRRISVEDMENRRTGDMVRVTPKILSLLDYLFDAITEVERMQGTKRHCAATNGQRILDMIEPFLMPERVNVWMDVDENGIIALCCGPKDVAGKLATFVWNGMSNYVLTSGTMSDGVDFSYFKKENGLSEISESNLLETAVPSPFDYMHHTRLYIPDDLPMPDNSEEYITAISNRIVDLVEATCGHTAILFTSYKVLQMVYEQTKDRLQKYQVICMARSNKTAIKDFQKSKNGVLFASGSMWEGVDCVGNCLSSVIIVRLPFPIRSAAMEQKKELCDSIRSFVQQYAVPEMIIKLRQGAGRLIRCETDAGVLSILDARVAHGGNYRGRVCKALEKYPIARSVEDVAAFIHSVKESEYFQ